MSNRLLSVFILIWVFVSGYIYYEFKYVPKMIKKQEEKALELKLEQENKEKIKNKEKKVSLEQIKEQKQVENNKIIEKNKNIKIIENKIDSQTIKQKIEYLKQIKNAYVKFELKNWKIFYFMESNNKLLLYISWQKLWEFNKVEVKDLNVLEIIWNNDYIFLQIWENKYLYNLLTKQMNILDLKPSILYVKSWINTQEFLFKTKLWIYIYTYKNNKFEYFNFFEDFVYYKNWYLWIINKSDTRRLSNLSINQTNNNLIVYYNPNSKEKDIVYKTNLALKKIYFQNNKIYFEDSQNKEYELENIK